MFNIYAGIENDLSSTHRSGEEEVCRGGRRSYPGIGSAWGNTLSVREKLYRIGDQVVAISESDIQHKSSYAFQNDVALASDVDMGNFVEGMNNVLVIQAQQGREWPVYIYLTRGANVMGLINTLNKYFDTITIESYGDTLIRYKNGVCKEKHALGYFYTDIPEDVEQAGKF